MKNLIPYIAILNLLFFSLTVTAQTTCHKLGFVNNQEIEVKKNSHPLTYPWAGGINSVYFF
jgi:hypothetical protein